MNGHVVVDASLVFKWLVKEEDSWKADALARLWRKEGIRIAAPYLMPVEVTNALHRRVVRGEITLEEAAYRVKTLLSSGLELHEPPDLHGRALELASQLRQGAVYDVHHLALAETLDCDLWTADEKFFRAAGPAATNLRWIGEVAPPG